MKGKTGMQALSVLLAVMLAGAVMVSVVSADVKNALSEMLSMKLR